MKESEFKNWFRDHWYGWMESYEPRAGSGMGIPDLQVLIEGKLLPIELKVGEVKNGLLIPNEVRPAQIGWHKRFWDAGGVSAFVIGVGGSGKTPSAVYIVSGIAIKSWDFGFEVDKLWRVDKKDTLLSMVRSWFEYQKGFK